MSGIEAFPILGIDHLHLIVGNASQAAFFYRSAFGFALKAWRGPETGTPDHVSYVLEQGAIRLILSSPLTPDHPTYDHIRKHGDGIRDIAFAVEDPAAAWKSAIERGAESAYEPSALEDDRGVLKMAGIRAFGDTIHSFVGRKTYTGAFRPGYGTLPHQDDIAHPSGLLHLAGLAVCVKPADLRRWTSLYERALGFTAAQPMGEFSATLSKDLAGGGSIQLLIEAPGGQQQSSIQNFLDSYQGPGLRRVSFASADPAASIAQLTARGVLFAEAAGGLASSITQSVHDRPTLFYEIVQA